MTLTCVIPAYNEQARIGAVLAAVLDHPLIDDVLVVDDGSKDATSDVVRRFPKARLITLAQNGGKTAALARAFAETRSEVILLIDADLVGLSPAHLTALITPVTQGRATMSISVSRSVLIFLPAPSCPGRASSCSRARSRGCIERLRNS